MPINKQVEKIAIQVGEYSGGEFTPHGDPVLYDIWNYDGRWRTDWRGGVGNTRTLAGRDLSGAGGFRLDLRINLRGVTEIQKWNISELIKDIFDVPAFPKAVKISPDEDIENGTVCNLRSGYYGYNREFTVDRPVVSMDFSGVERVATIPDSYQILGEADPVLPDAPLDFNVDVTYFPTLAACSWSAVGDVDGYNVYLKSNGEFVKQNVELIEATEYDIEGLEDGNYESYVTFVQGGVESDPSDIEEFEVLNLVIVSSGLSTSDVTASSESFDGNRMNVFNEVNFSLWVADTWQNEWVRIDFGEQIEVLYVIHRNGTELGTPKEWKIQGSNDDSTWDDLLVVEQSERVAADEPHELPITGMYRYYRLFVTESWDDENVIRVRNTRLFAIE